MNGSHRRGVRARDEDPADSVRGRYRRARIKSDSAFTEIPNAYAALSDLGSLADDGREWFELYHRHDEVDVHVPIVEP